MVGLFSDLEGITNHVLRLLHLIHIEVKVYMQAGCFVLIIVVLIEGALEVEPPGSSRASLHLGAVLGSHVPGPLSSYSECRRS